MGIGQLGWLRKNIERILQGAQYATMQTIFEKGQSYTD
jgi:hypothetical protein